MITKLSYWKKACVGCLASAAMTIAASAQTFTTLAFFSDSSSVFSALTQGTDGNLYGTSNNGGTKGFGSVFSVTSSGVLTTVYSFCAEVNCADGSFPFSALALGRDGNFYGTTQNGGTGGLGTVFKISPNGAFTVIHSFDGTDGSYPDAGLVLGSDGNFYGTTSFGGAANSCLGQCGTIFKITPSGTLTTLHSFEGDDGDAPFAPLVQGTDGSFYGTTVFGGTGNTCNGGSCGTVFKITPGGRFTSLHSFTYTDGQEPFAPLVQSAGGGFYGTTFKGGDTNFHSCTAGCGTVFKITSGGTFATVHKFHGGDGGNPESGLVQATDGSFYGESQLSGDGEIFNLSLPSTLATLYSFSAASGGGGNTPVVQATDGKFYGTYGVPGAVFSFDVGLGPFVTFVIATGKVGKTAQILGQGLTGATSVTFNGTPATSFTIVSDTYMTAVVPIGATTGSVIVATASGPLTSNVNFRITK